MLPTFIRPGVTEPQLIEIYATLNAIRECVESGRAEAMEAIRATLDECANKSIHIEHL